MVIEGCGRLLGVESESAASFGEEPLLDQREKRRTQTCVEPLDLESIGCESLDLVGKFARRASQRASLRLRLDLALTVGEHLNRLEDGQTGGVYSVPTPAAADTYAVFKPESEEGFERRGIPVGGGAVREEAAYILDRLVGYVARVPVTTRIEVPVDALETTDNADASQPYTDEVGEAPLTSTSYGSVQRFVPRVAGSSEDFGMPRSLAAATRIVAVAEAQHVACLDIRLCNTDRHSGNLLFQHSARYQGDGHPAFDEPRFVPIPIDHGCTLPCWWAIGESNYEAWADWPQVHAPVVAEVLEAIEVAHSRREEALEALAQLGLARAAQATYRIALAALREGIVRHGLSIAAVAGLMTRDSFEFETPSWIEQQLAECAGAIGYSLSWDKDDRGDLVLTVPQDPTAWPPDGLVEALEAKFSSDALLLAGMDWEKSKGINKES